MLSRKLRGVSGSLVYRCLSGLTALCNTAESGHPKQDLAKGPDLHYFLRESTRKERNGSPLQPSASAEGQRVYLETYGCQMNVNDSEVVLSVLDSNGFHQTSSIDSADVILLNTCAIREKPEQKIWSRLGEFRKLKRRAKGGTRSGPIVGVLGCMAERLKDRLLDVEKLADIVVGPDAYRDLPRLIDIVKGGSHNGQGAMNTQLSVDETYADIVPLRPIDSVKAFLTIMRGCNNMCSFCIVPFTRGRERSRSVQSIVGEVKKLEEMGVKEVTLLGQNVNSYADFSTEPRWRNANTGNSGPYSVYAPGFKSIYKPKRQGSVQFAELVHRVAEAVPEMRIRFTSPHPKDFSDDVIEVIAEHPNVCKQLHLPAQSGSNSVLDRMKRGYTREAYDTLVDKARNRIPRVALSTDIIVGFCGEMEVEHNATVDLLETVGYELAFLFKYSERAKTHASRHLADDVPPEVKSRRLSEVIAVYRDALLQKNLEEIGERHLVLVEEKAQKNGGLWTGRTDTMKRVTFPDLQLPASLDELMARPDCARVGVRSGDYVAVEIDSATHSTLSAKPIARTSLLEYARLESQL